MIITPESYNCNKRMAARSVIKKSHNGFVKECKRLFEYKDRQFKVKEYSKYRKCEGNTKLKYKQFYIQKVRYIIVIFEKIIEMKVCKCIGISTMYNF